MRNRTARATGVPDRPTSILAVDFGNTTTRALLIDLVEGVYAVVAEAQTLTTAGFPIGDVSAGLARVVRDLGAIAGRKLIGGDGKILTPEQPDRSGVDVFLATASIGRPLRTILMGLVPEISITSGQRAAAGTYIDIVDTYTLDDSRSPQEQLNAMVRAYPDLFFIVGGTEDGALDPVLELARRAQLAVRLLPLAARPIILYAGNSAARDAIARLFSGLTAVLFADNVRPTLEDEALSGAQVQLAQAFDTVSGSRGVGFETVGQMTRLGVLPNAQSYALIVNFLGQAQPGKNFAAFDIGSATSTMSAVVNGHLATSIRTDIGLGQSARTLLDAAGTAAIRRWLPFTASENEIRAYALNKTLRPATVPEGLRGLYLEHALLRAAITTLLAAARPAWTPTQALDDVRAPLPAFERIIGAGGGLVGTGRPGMSA
ncbi:MAG: glutamate mutase L, partial [Anaerolinea sp.]|nr:glutamate mutase L [Anaerolinea sp.]